MTTAIAPHVDPYDALNIQCPEQAMDLGRREIRTAEDRWIVDQVLRVFAAYDPFVVEPALGRPLTAAEWELVGAEFRAARGGDLAALLAEHAA